MGKANRNPQHPMILARKSHRFPPPEVRRTATHVDCNIQNFAAYNPHQLSLRVLHLIMQASQHIAGRAGMIVLHKIPSDSRICHGSLVVALQEKTALVFKHPWFQHKHFWEGSRDFLQSTHGRASLGAGLVIILSLAKAEASTFRNYYSSSNSRSFRPVPPGCNPNGTQFLQGKPPSTPVSFRSPGCRAMPPSTIHGFRCRARPFHAPSPPPPTGRAPDMPC